jgi:DNA polymerase-3 subunit beta
MNQLHLKRDQLLKPLQIVSGIVERKHTLPILSNFLIQSTGQTLTCIATDTEIQVSCVFPLEGGLTNDEAPFEITVAAKKLLDILRSLPEAADVQLKLDQLKMQVLAGKSRFTLQTLPAKDYPLVNVPHEWLSQFSVSQQKLKGLLNQVHYAMAHQDVRYYLNSVLLVVEDQHLRAITTDGHRLAYASEPMEQDVASEHLEILIPRKTVAELQRLLDDDESMVNVDIAANQVRFSFKNIEFVSKLVQGKFPDFRRVIPQDNHRTIVIQREVLLRAIQQAALLTTDKFRGVRLMLNTNVLSLSTNNTDQEDATIEIEVDYQEAALDIGFNINYILDVLTNLKTENVVLSFKDSNSSALFTMVDSNQFKYVVMPMRI